MPHQLRGCYWVWACYYVWRDYLSKPEALQSLRPAWNSTKKSTVQGQSEHSAIPVADLEHEVTPLTP